MDEMTVKLRSGFMKKIAAKLIARAIYKKIGYHVDVNIDKLEVESFDGDTSISASVDLKLKSSEFVKIMKGFDDE